MFFFSFNQFFSEHFYEFSLGFLRFFSVFLVFEFDCCLLVLIIMLNVRYSDRANTPWNENFRFHITCILFVTRRKQFVDIKGQI